MDDGLARRLQGLDPAAVEDIISDLPEPVAAALLGELAPSESETLGDIPGPLEMGRELDQGYRSRPHLTYLSKRLSAAVRDVEGGKSRYLTVSMPPRSGKSQMISVYFPVWLLHQHPEWKIGLISHSPTLATAWGRQVRRIVEEDGDLLGVDLARDAGAASEWQTTVGGSVTSRSAPGQSITGLGFKVLVVDDPVKDFASAHSELARDALWAWWQANAQTRLEPPSLVVFVGTRWHEDDVIGRLLSPVHSADPDQWENICFPAIAEVDDVLGRVPGAPLYTPLLKESKEEALARWARVKASVGSYSWAGLYQQHPSPAQGDVFDSGWWRFWTRDPKSATADGKVVFLDPEEPGFTAAGGTPLEGGPGDQVSAGHSGGRWLDSWDCTFKGTYSSDFVVGQRWLKRGPYRFLIDQQRGRWSFTQTLEAMKAWGPDRDDGYNRHVHEVLVEDKANGSAVIDVMRKTLSGLIPISPRESKESRARAVTPDIESHHVLLPFPGDPGNGWVADYLDEFRNFPHGTHDDQVDASTQALNRLRERGVTRMAVPRGSARGGGSGGMSRLGPGARSRVGALRTMRPRV